MKMPLQNKTGLAKAIAILASVFTISLGLCGANFLVDAAAHSSSSRLGGLIIVTGVAESIAIVLSGAGLVIVNLVWIVREIVWHFASPNKDQD